MWNPEAVYALLDEQNKEAKDLALFIGVSPSTISDWRSGRLKPPAIDKIEKTADFFNVSIDHLLGRDVNPARGGVAPGEEHWLVKAYGRASDNIQRSIKAQLEPYMEETAQETIPAKKAM